MLDPVVCAGMTIGPPRVDLAALVELKRLLIGRSDPADSRSDSAIVREECNDASQIAGDDVKSTNELAVRYQDIGRIGLSGTRQGHLDTGPDSDAGGWPADRGA